MLKKEDFTYYIKNIFAESIEAVPIEERVKLAKQIAEIFLEVGDFDKAEEIILRIKESEEFGKLNYSLQYIVLKTLYRIAYKKGKFKEAENILLNTLNLLESHQDESRICFVFVKLGNVYTALKNYDKANEFYFRAIDTGERIDEKGCLASAYNNIAVYYAAVRKNYDEALIQFQKALSLYETVRPGSEITCSIMINIGSVFKHKELYDKALDYYQRAHTIAKKLHKYNLLAHIYKEKAEIYYALGEFDISKVFAERALTVFDTIDGYESRKWIAEIFMLLGKILYRQKASFEEISNKFDTSAKLFKEYGTPHDLINLYKKWAEISLDKGLKREAKNLLENALKIAEDHGLKEIVDDMKNQISYL